MSLHGVDVAERFRAVVAFHARPASRAAEIADGLAVGFDLPVTVVDESGAGSPFGADVLVVIDALGGGPGGDALFDRQAERLLTGARGPVLLVGPRAASPDAQARLVVPIDGAGLRPAVGSAIAGWIATFGRRPITVVSLRAPDPWPHDDSDPVVDAARTAVAELSAQGVEVGLLGQTVTDPAGGILDVVRAADVVVVPSPRHLPSRTHWFATARRLVRGAPCPVLVVPVES